MATATPAPSFLATRRGKLTLALLCAVAFLDFVDASIVNVALPSIRQDLHFSVAEPAVGAERLPADLRRVHAARRPRRRPAGPPPRARRRHRADRRLLADRRASPAARACLSAPGSLQGVGAAMTLPAALSILTTTFKEGTDRHTALGVWGGVGGLASAAGVLLGGAAHRRPRLALGDVRQPDRLRARARRRSSALISRRATPRAARELRRARRRPGDRRDAAAGLRAGEGADVGWGSARTIGELAGALALLVGVRRQRAAPPATRSRRCRSSGSTGSASPTSPS